MNLKRTNEIFAYSFLTIGITRVLLLILILLQLVSNLSQIASGETIDYNYYQSFSGTIAVVQLILGISSIFMIIIHLKKRLEISLGYFYGLIAFLIAIFGPSLISFFSIFAEASMYIKAGSQIIKTNFTYNDNKKNKKLIKDTDWFYSEKKTVNQIDTEKLELRKAKILREIEEWKELLNSGEIDEIIYNEEVNKLINKASKKWRIQIDLNEKGDILNERN